VPVELGLELLLSRHIPVEGEPDSTTRARQPILN
jgi:hypothetical protein